MPLVIAPTGTAGLMWYEGELALARAARAAGIPFTLATGSMTAMERVADEAGGELWFQLYMWPDRSLSHELVERAKAAGYKALVVTVDGVSAGNREYNIRNGFTIPFTFSTRNVVRHGHASALAARRHAALPGHERHADVRELPRGGKSKNDQRARWAARACAPTRSAGAISMRLRKIWPHKLIVKGVLDPQDAATAVDHGADGIDVSNHGGRNLDGIVSPIEVLPEIVDAVGKRATVFMDSGIRRGSDVVKAPGTGRERGDGRPLDALWRCRRRRSGRRARARNLSRGNQPRDGVAGLQYHSRSWAADMAVSAVSAVAAPHVVASRAAGGRYKGSRRSMRPGASQPTGYVSRGIRMSKTPYRRRRRSGRAGMSATADLGGCSRPVGRYHSLYNMSFFVTSVGSGKGADYGGLTGADRHCQALATEVERASARGAPI